jgi:MFS family permease
MTRRLALVLLAVAAAQAAQYIVRPLTSYRLLALGAGAREVGLVTAAFALVPMLVAIPLGRLTDSRRSTLLVTGGAAVLAVASALLGLASNVAAIAAATALFGLGHLALMLGAQNVIARESADELHDRRFGLFTATVSLGQMLGPLLGGYVLSSRGHLGLIGATGRGMEIAAGVAALAMLFGLAAGRGPARDDKPAEDVRHGGTIRALARTPGVPAGIFASLVVLSCVDVFTAYLPVLGQQRAIGPGVVGLLLALRAAASFCARIGIATAVSRVGRTRLIACSALASAVGVVLVTATRDTAVLAILSLLVGYGLGFGQPLTMTLVVQTVPASARATALGLRLTGNRIGQVATPALAGLLAGGAGVTPVFWLLGGLLVSSAAAVHRSRPGADD